MREKQLVRNPEDKMLFGVCSGLANYLRVDPVLVRLAFVLFVILGHGAGLLVYLLLAILMPEPGMPVAKANAFDDEEIIIKNS
ncbi:MAG: PspC domain-containing protein [Chloroflexi bacterium]|nr:PspC domain-containing protein [Chloroflexota bacterium]